MAAPTRITVAPTRFAFTQGPEPRGAEPGEYVDARSYDDATRALAEVERRLPHDARAMLSTRTLLTLQSAKTSSAPTVVTGPGGPAHGRPSGADGDQPAKFVLEGEAVYMPGLLGDAFGISRSEARRCLMTGGVRLDGAELPLAQTLESWTDDLDGRTLTLGKRRAVRLTTSPAPVGTGAAFTGVSEQGGDPPRTPAGATAAATPPARAGDGGPPPRDAAPAGKASPKLDDLAEGAE